MDKFTKHSIGTVVIVMTIVSGLVKARALWGVVIPSETAAIACEGNDELFPQTYDAAGAWRTTFRKTMEDLLEQHRRQMTAPPMCDGNIRTPPSDTLKKIASKLSPWKDDGNMEELGEEDMAAVALSYTSAYECALKERSTTIFSSKYFAHPSNGGESNASSSVSGLPVNVFADDVQSEKRVIEQELLIARPTVHRALTLVAGQGRTQPLMNSLRCLELASIDIRNALGLAAQLTSLLPRAFDASTTLRNPAQP
jgi:hypothetical protein